MQNMYLILLSDTQNPIKMLSFANIVWEGEALEKVAHCEMYDIQIQIQICDS